MISKSNRLIGSILLVSGTTIGAAMLALPATTGLAGFFPSLLIMSLVWVLMIFTALYLLEVNLRLKGEPNIISMVKKTLKGPGEAVAWVTYLFLLYSLIAAYMVGSSKILSSFFSPYLDGLPTWVWPIGVFLLFATFIYFGTKVADWFNRILMLLLALSYFALIVPGVTHIQLENLLHYDWHFLLPSLSVVATTFGYHIIIPTLTTYLEHDIKLLRKAIIIGSIIPFVVYLLWLVIVMGVVPVHGTLSLTSAAEQGEQATFYLREIVKSPLLHYSAQFFSLFAIITSLLGVSLSLSDFLTDGLKMKKDAKGKMTALLLTFIPPLLFALFYPQGFIIALRYAGIFVVILLAILPILMVFSERYGLKKARSLLPSHYTVWGGRGMLYAVALFSFLLLLIEIWY